MADLFDTASNLLQQSPLGQATKQVIGGLGKVVKAIPKEVIDNFKKLAPISAPVKYPDVPAIHNTSDAVIKPVTLDFSKAGITTPTQEEMLGVGRFPEAEMVKNAKPTEPWARTDFLETPVGFATLKLLQTIRAGSQMVGQSPAAFVEILDTLDVNKGLKKLIPQGVVFDIPFVGKVKSTFGTESDDEKWAQGAWFAVADLNASGITPLKDLRYAKDAFVGQIKSGQYALQRAGIAPMEIDATGGNILQAVNNKLKTIHPDITGMPATPETKAQIEALTDLKDYVRNNPITSRIAAVANQHSISPEQIYQGMTQNLERLALTAPKDTLYRQTIDDLNSFVQNPKQFLSEHGGLSIKDVSKVPLFPGEISRMPQLYGGEKALEYPTSTKFSTLTDKITRFEIDDSKAKLLTTAPQIAENVAIGNWPTLGDVLKHDELFKNYPDAKNIIIAPVGEQGILGTSANNMIQIDTNVKDKNTTLSTILHEVQHWIQEKEGFATGSAATDATKDYIRTAGEVEARDVSARMGMDKEQRISNMPYTSQGISPKEQIVSRPVAETNIKNIQKSATRYTNIDDFLNDQPSLYLGTSNIEAAEKGLLTNNDANFVNGTFRLSSKPKDAMDYGSNISQVYLNVKDPLIVDIQKGDDVGSSVSKLLSKEISNDSVLVYSDGRLIDAIVTDPRQILSKNDLSAIWKQVHGEYDDQVLQSGVYSGTVGFERGKTLEQISEKGWKPGVKAEFDRALMDGDRATVERLLPSVPQAYKNKFSKEIEGLSSGDIGKTAEERVLIKPEQPTDLSYLTTKKDFKGHLKTFVSRLVDSEAIKKIGKSGEQIFNKIKLAEHTAVKEGSDAMFKLKSKLEVLSKEDSANFFDYVEGKKPTPPSAQPAVDEWKNIAKDIADKSQEYGIMIKTPGGKVPFKPKADYVPYYVDENKLDLALKSAVKKNDLLQEMAAKGKITVAKASEILDDMVNGKESMFGHLEKARMANLPDSYYKREPVYLFDYIKNAYDRLSMAKEFGGDDAGLQALIEEARKSGADYQELQALTERALGRETFDRTITNISRGARAYNNITKLSLAALTNIGDIVKPFVRTNFLSTIKGIRQSFTKAGTELAEKAGVTGKYIKDMLDVVGDTTIDSKMFKITGFNLTENKLRQIAVNAAKNYVDLLVKKLRSNPNNAFALRRLEQFGLDGKELLKNGVKESDYIDAGIQAVADAQPTSKLDIPYYWQSPVGKMATQYKTFSYKQARFFGKFIKDELKKGNPKPLIMFLLVGAAVGEGVADLKAAARGRTRIGWDDPVRRVIDDLMTVGGVGLATDFLANMQYGTLGGGFLKFVVGPTLSDIDDTISRTVSDVQNVRAGKDIVFGRPPDTGETQIKTLKKAIYSVPVLGPIVSNLLFPTRGNYQSKTIPIAEDILQLMSESDKTTKADEIRKRLKQTNKKNVADEIRKKLKQ